MYKKILMNNLIALLLYVLMSILLMALNMIIIQATAAFADILVVPLIAVPLCVAIIAYIFCGFLLKPVEKLSFLSVVSVTIALTILLIMFMQLGEAGVGYYFMNPIAWPLLQLMQFDIINAFRPFVVFLTVVFYLSPVFPSLLFYLGMVLRGRIVKR